MKVLVSGAAWAGRFVAMAGVVLLFCLGGAAPLWAGDGPRVVASIKPVHSLVAAVMKGVGVPALVVAGAGSPHGYNLKPSEAEALQDADAIFWIGEELETFLAKPIRTLAGQARQVALIRAGGVTRRNVGEGHGHDTANQEDANGGGRHDHDEHNGHDGHGSSDAHIWLDPLNANAMVTEIAHVLSELDPSNAPAYQRNADELSADLERLDAEIRDLLRPVQERAFVVFHDAYGHFEARYALNPAGALTVNPEVSAGAGRIAQMQAAIQSTGATCIFTEPQFQPKLARALAEASGAKTAVLDPLGASPRSWS